MSRLRNSLAGVENSLESTPPAAATVKYGMARTLTDSEFHFSENGKCNTWEIVQYAQVKKFTTLSPVRCEHDGKFYPFYEFVFY